MRKKSRPMEPFASYSEEGDLMWNECLVKRVKELGKLGRIFPYCLHNRVKT